MVYVSTLNMVEHSNQKINCFVAITSRMDPCEQIVIAGNAMSDMGLPVVLSVVIVGSACQVL